MIEQYLCFAGLIDVNNGPGSDGLGSQVEWTTPGTYTWTVPDDVFSVSTVVISAGSQGTTQANVGAVQGGSSGFIRWSNNIAVTPGDQYTIVVGSGGVARAVPFTEAQIAQTNAASSALGITAGLTAGESTPKSATVGGGDGRSGAAGNQDATMFGGGNAPTFTANAVSTTTPGRGTSLVNVTVNGVVNNGGNHGGGGSAQSRNSGNRTCGKGGDGGVRIIWGRDRAYPDQKITNV